MIPASVLRVWKGLFLAFSQFGTANQFNNYGKLGLVFGREIRIERNANYE